jgi:hypothetical protein
MSMSKTTILVIVLAFVFVVAVVYALFHLGEVNKREVVNRYYGSEFSFTYPLGYELEEDAGDTLSIGSTTQSGFASVIDFTRVPVPTDTADFTAYMREKILEICSTQGVGERTYCTAVESEQKVETLKGESAQMFRLTLVREVPGQEPQTFSYGPLYVYLIGPLENDDERTFEALVVHPSITSVLAGNVDQALLTQINDSVRRGEERK